MKFCNLHFNLQVTIDVNLRNFSQDATYTRDLLYLCCTIYYLLKLFCYGK